MLPEDWPYECWGFITFSTHTSVWIRDWRVSPDEVKAQNELLRGAVAPLLCSRQWFFRRRGLEQDLLGREHMAPACLAVYVKLDPQRANPERDLRQLRTKLRRKRRDVAVIRCWDRRFGGEEMYGPPVAQAALRHCCCDMASEFLGDGDPYGVAVKWIRQTQARENGVKHWLWWITGGERVAVEQELDRRLAGTPGIPLTSGGQSGMRRNADRPERIGE